jgi:hypothetical protein
MYREFGGGIMNNLFLYLIFAIVGMVGMYALYKPQVNKYEKTLNFSYMMLPLPYILGLYALGSVAAFFMSENADFIETLTATRVFVPLVLTAVIYAVGFCLSERLFFLVTIACVGLTVWLQPIGDGNAYPELPIWGLQLLIFVFACVYCLGGMISNFLPHTLLIPQIMLLLGLSMMSALGAAPLFVAFCSAILIGVLSGYLSINFYEVKIEIDNAAAVALSYLVCSLLLFNSGELGLPSCIILTSVFWAELLSAFWRRFFVVRSGSLAENTNYYLAAQVLSVKALVLSILRVCVVILFIAWFQLYAVNGYSLVIISLFVALWLNGSIGSPNGGKRSLKEINREFLADLKQSIAETKEVLGKKDKDKE